MDHSQQLLIEREKCRILSEVVYAGISAYHKFMAADKKKYTDVVFRLFEVSKAVGFASTANFDAASEDLMVARERFQEIKDELE